MERKDRVITNEIQTVSDQNRILRFITSTEEQDRDGDIIEVAGWQIDNYMKNPVVLFGHDYGSLPVGKTVGIELDHGNKRMYQDIKFATRDEYEFADTVYRMCKAGYLNTTSVGFMGIEHEAIFDQNKNYVGRRYRKQELLETSIVPVPSNPGALVEARSKGIINDHELKFLEKPQEKQLSIPTQPSVFKLLKSLRETIYQVYKNPDEEYVSVYIEDLYPINYPDGLVIIEQSNDVYTLREYTYNPETDIATLGMESLSLQEIYVPKGVKGMEVKSGATLSAKSKEFLKSIHEELVGAEGVLKGCHGKLKEFMMPQDDTEEEDEEDGCGKPPKKDFTPEPIIEPIVEPIIEPIIEPITGDEIDIESLEDPDEIDCTPEELDKAISTFLDKKINQLKGGK